MPERKREDLWRALQDRRLESLYLFYGPEDYLRGAAVNEVTERVLGDTALREFNYAAYSLAQTDVQQALSNASQLPLMAERRLLLLQDFQKLREADEEAVSRYLNNPAASTVVVFIAADMDKRRKLTKLLLEKCYAVEFAQLENHELTKWARRYLKDKKTNIEERALAHLVGLVGSNIRLLAVELDKLMTAAIGEGQITWPLVESLVGRSRELSNFELSDHLLAGNKAGALLTLKNLLDDRAEPLMLLGLLASQYHRLLLAKELMQLGAPRDEVFRLVAMPYSRREEFLAQARRCDAKRLAKCLARVAETDLAIKTSKGTPRLQLELLVSELAG
jgi:DNA polymerase-3 subunit delta